MIEINFGTILEVNQRKYFVIVFMTVKQVFNDYYLLYKSGDNFEKIKNNWMKNRKSGFRNYN